MNKKGCENFGIYEKNLITAAERIMARAEELLENGSASTWWMTYEREKFIETDRECERYAIIRCKVKNLGKIVV